MSEPARPDKSVRKPSGDQTHTTSGNQEKVKAYTLKPLFTSTSAYRSCLPTRLISQSRAAESVATTTQKPVEVTEEATEYCTTEVQLVAYIDDLVLFQRRDLLPRNTRR